jgi:non-heme chloroperoxidase
MIMAAMALTAMTVARVTLATGVTLEYVERGDPKGTPVIFLHGVTDSWRSFEPMLPHLPASIRAIAVTQRGHGESSRPDGYRYADFSADVAALLDALQIRSAVIVGHSMGSLVAQRFAIDHPTIKGHPEVQALWDGALANLTDPVPPALAREFQVSTLAQPIAPALLDVFVGESLKVPARVWQATFREFLDTDFSADLGRITAPTLVIWADKDGFSRRQERDALVAGIRGAIAKDYTGAGHAMHWEEPARVAGDIAQFVAGLPAATERQ